MLIKTSLIAALAIFAAAPSPEPPEPPPVTLTHKQVMTLTAAIETLQKDKDAADEAMVYWYKKATECGNTSKGRRSI